MVSHFTKFRLIHFTETRVTNSQRFYSNNIFSMYAKFLKKLSSISITFLKTKLTLPILSTIFIFTCCGGNSVLHIVHCTAQSFVSLPQMKRITKFYQSEKQQQNVSQKIQAQFVVSRSSS